MSLERFLSGPFRREVRQFLTSFIAAIVGEMPEQHKRFLISVRRGEPDWALLGLPGAKDLPAVRWKLENLVSKPFSLAFDTAASGSK